jgi:hypothetical protein
LAIVAGTAASDVLFACKTDVGSARSTLPTSLNIIAVVPGPNPYSDARNNGSLTALAVSGDSVYWLEGGTMRSCPKTGCAGKPSAILGSLPGIGDNSGLLVVGQNAYVVADQANGTNNWNLVSCSLPDCASWTTILTPSNGPNDFGPQSQRQFATDGTNLYWIERHTYGGGQDYQLNRCALPNCPPPIQLHDDMGSLAASPSVLAAAGNVYYATSAAFAKCEGGTPNSAAVIKECPPSGEADACKDTYVGECRDGDVELLAADAHNLYFIRGYGTAGANLYRCTIPGCNDAQNIGGGALFTSDGFPPLQAVVTSRRLYLAHAAQDPPFGSGGYELWECASPTDCNSNNLLLDGQGFDAVMIPGGYHFMPSIASDGTDVYFVAHGPFGLLPHSGVGQETDVWAIVSTAQ